MLSALAALVGFLIRYLPHIGGFIADIFKGREDDRRQERLAKLQERLEEKRSELVLKGLKVRAEIEEALAGLKADIAMVMSEVKNQQSAREYHSKLVSIMAQTLEQGKKLGIHPVVLNVCFLGVMFVEMVAAAIVPAIAITVMWIYVKYRFFGEMPTTYGPQDYEIFWAILGYFVAARTQKFTDSRRVRIATGDDK